MALMLFTVKVSDGRGVTCPFWWQLVWGEEVQQGQPRRSWNHNLKTLGSEKSLHS